MSDRLKELQRQRALIQEQLAWLDQEIAAAGGANATKPSAPQTVPSFSNRFPSRAPILTGPPVMSPAAAADADELISRYGSTTQPVESEVKRGCFIYFAVALILLSIGVVALYLHTTRK